MTVAMHRAAAEANLELVPASENANRAALLVDMKGSDV